MIDEIKTLLNDAINDLSTLRSGSRATDGFIDDMCCAKQKITKALELIGSNDIVICEVWSEMKKKENK